MKVGAIVLAAGRATRMRGTHKLTADLGGKPVIAHALDAVAAAGLPALVVLGDRAARVRAAVGERDVGFVTSPDYEHGLSCSLRAGIAAAPADWDAALVVLGDMPRVTAATMAALAAAAASQNAVVVPHWHGRRGNPVLWGRFHFPALARLSGDRGGRALLSLLPVTLVAADSDGVLIDIDTPEALTALQGDRI